jgi:hypothetical protein
MSFFRLSANSKFIGTAPLFILILAVLSCSGDQIATVQQPTSDDLLPVIDNPQFTRFVFNQDVGKEFESPLMSAFSSDVGNSIGEAGGTLTNGFVTLVFPEGAVDDDTYITIRMLDEVQFIFELLPHGIQFDAPVTVILHLEQTTAAGNVAENTVVWYDEFGNVWKELPTTPVDATTVQTDLMHFSKYGDVGG